MDIKKRDIARAFNPFLVAKSDKLKKLIEEVQQQIEGYEAYYQTRQRARRVSDQKTHEWMIEAILCDLCLLHLDPQYDAVLVAEEDKETAVRVMKEVFREHTGITPEVTH